MTEKLGELSVDVEPKTKAELEALARALAELTKKSDEAEKKSDGLGEALTKVGNAARGAQALATGGLALAQQLIGAAVEGERTERAMTALGSSYELVRRATNDTVTAQDAYRARLTLTTSGLRINGTELATVARYAREHRQATESSAEAVQRLVESLREGEQGGLRQFGIAVDQGASRARTFEHALRQMQHANEQGAPAARTLGEEVTRTGAAFADGLGALANWASRASGLQGILSRIATSFRQIASDARDLQQLGEDGDQQRATQARRQRAMEGYGGALRDVNRALAGAGLDRTAAAGVDVSGLRPEQAEAIVARMRSLAAVSSGAQSEVGADDIAARAISGRRGAFTVGGTSAGDLDAAAAATAAGLRGGGLRAQNAAQLRTGLRELAQEIVRTRAANAAGSATPGEDAGPRDSARGMPTGPTYGEQQQLRRAAAEVAQQQFAEELQLRQAASEAQIDANLRAAQEETKARQSAAEFAQDALRQQLADEGKARRAASEAEIDRASRDSDLRIRLFEREHDAAAFLREGVVSAYDAMTGAAGEWLVALATGADGATEAFQRIASAKLLAISAEATGQALQSTAEGIYYSFTAPPIAATKFLAALKFGAIAAGAGLGGALLAPSTGGAAGGGSSGQSARGGASLLPAAPSASSTTPTTTTINYFAPVIGGRESTDAETGSRLQRYDRAAGARLQRPRAA